MKVMKEDICNFVLGLGVDDVGFVSADDYQSPRSSSLDSLFPGVRSMIVMAFRELTDQVVDRSDYISVRDLQTGMRRTHHKNHLESATKRTEDRQ